MERFRGYRDKDIEIDLNDVNNRLDQAIELKAKVKDDKQKEIQKIIETTRAEKDILKKHVESYQRREDNIKFVDFLKDDTRYQQMKEKDIDILKEAHMKNNMEHIKEAKKITDKATERLASLEKIENARDKTKDLERER